MRRRASEAPKPTHIRVVRHQADHRAVVLESSPKRHQALRETHESVVEGARGHYCGGSLSDCNYSCVNE